MANAYSESDYWTKKAFKEGYPARSVYKLEEINKKFSIFSSSAHILDLGAAPGSWTSFLLKNLGKSSSIVSVDLKPLDDKVKDGRLTFIQGDMTDKKIIAMIGEKMPFDAVVCDVAPYTTGHKALDVARQNELAFIAMDYAKKMLKNGGAFVTKIFQGQEMNLLMKELKNDFEMVRSFKPIACRKNSIETYIIGKNFKAK
ncbi:MAG: SAM-dependent methyltransferase [Treponema sp.]